MVDPAVSLADGRTALGAGAWDRARLAFEASLDAEESADAHAGLAGALWWLGELDAAIAHRERAYALYRKADKPGEALECALLVMLDYQGHVGNFAATSGWLARARRLVDDHGIPEVEGWLDLVMAGQDGDPAERERDARAALDAARETGDLDLELCALSRLGHRLVEQGRITEGMSHLDEAMAGSLAGEGEDRGTVVLTSCNMMVSCVGAADYARAVQWIRTADRFSEEVGCPFLYAECRTIYGTVLHATGDWAGAERELRSAISASEGTVPVFHAQALAALAQLRFTQGRHAEARRLVAGIENHPWAVPVVALLHLASGRAEAARAVLHRREQSASTSRLELGTLLAVLGDAELARGDLDAAMAAGDRLTTLTAEGDCAVLEFRAARLSGRIASAKGDLRAARRYLDAAVHGFADLGMPHEAATTRVLLAETHLTSDPEAARAELEMCFHVFDALGAGPDADRTAHLLRTIGASTPARSRTRADSGLTNREHEILDLLGEGLSNPEIADRLFISRKTVEHHVARVLSKLGVRNRTEAAAEAIRIRRSAGE